MSGFGHIPTCGIDSCGDGLPCACPCHITLQQHIETVLKGMTPDERVDFFNRVGEGYCKRCGYELYGRPCHCENDE